MFQTAFDTRLTALPSVKTATAAPAGSMSEVIVSDWQRHPATPAAADAGALQQPQTLADVVQPESVHE